jgi:N-acetylmuramoyl-L-alanine amidase
LSVRILAATSERHALSLFVASTWLVVAAAAPPPVPVRVDPARHPERAAPPPPRPVRWRAPVAEPPRLYRIRWGDTLWALARRFHTTVAALQAANDLGTSTLIDAGRDLVIPGRYVVQPGDTLAQIARRFGVPLVLLWHQNRLATDRLEPGQTLVIPYPGPVPGATYAAPAAPAGAAAPAYSAQDVMLLAHVIQAEAGNQPFLGMVAVGAVVLNRTRAPGFPSTIAGVVFQPGQFESVADGRVNLPVTPLAVAAARAALEGWDPTHGALYFYNPDLATDPWIRSLDVVTRIGQHVFCR